MLQVASVLHRMESLNSFLPINIHTTLKKHYLAISVTEARRTEDIAIVSKQQQPRTQDYFAVYKGSSLKLQFIFPLSASCNLPLLFRHPADGHGVERPCRHHKETPHCAVVCSSDGASQTSREPGSGHRLGKMPLSFRGRFF